MKMTELFPLKVYPFTLTNIKFCTCRFITIFPSVDSYINTLMLRLKLPFIYISRTSSTFPVPLVGWLVVLGLTAL